MLPHILYYSQYNPLSEPISLDTFVNLVEGTTRRMVVSSSGKPNIFETLISYMPSPFSSRNKTPSQHASVPPPHISLKPEMIQTLVRNRGGNCCQSATIHFKSDKLFIMPDEKSCGHKRPSTANFMRKLKRSLQRNFAPSKNCTSIFAECMILEDSKLFSGKRYFLSFKKEKNRSFKEVVIEQRILN